MLWIIDDKKNLDPAFSNDRDNLRHNDSLMLDPDHYEYSYTREMANAPWTGEFDEEEDIFVLAHAGNSPEPWIGGLTFGEFAGAMISKFGVGRLTDRTIWFLVCSAGTNVAGIAGLLKDKGVDNTNLYMPIDFMFISTAGIPHIIAGYNTSEAVDQVVAKNSSKYKLLSKLGAKPTGADWLGARISGNTTATIGAAAAQTAVRTRFDRNNAEY